ncbi:hypothetical protein [Ruminococcus sp.]|uniref:hypothetical protein n=1 Tax=Ruminococcus sp. TaxID=41978 RepID=UPI0025D57E04|nr:hypothetical protein [Ruminococcus sp.]
MPVVQEAFDISNDIMAKIQTGEYRRLGGIIRYAKGPKKGQIVKHLDPIESKPVKQVQSISSKALQFASKNKKALIASGITLVGVSAIYVCYKIKSREPKVIKQFRAALNAYIDEIRLGTLTLNSIEALMKALNEIKDHKDSSNIKIDLSLEDFDAIVNHIYEYTLKLAELNEYKLNNEELIHCGDSLDNLNNYLIIQKRIFKSAA